MHLLIHCREEKDEQPPWRYTGDRLTAALTATQTTSTNEEQGAAHATIALPILDHREYFMRLLAKNQCIFVDGKVGFFLFVLLLIILV